jgi:hypothetical protein
MAERELNQTAAQINISSSAFRTIYHILALSAFYMIFAWC